MTITTLAAHKGNTWKLELDDSGELYFLHVSVVQRCGLQKGMTLTPQQWEQVQTTELARKALIMTLLGLADPKAPKEEN